MRDQVDNAGAYVANSHVDYSVFGYPITSPLSRFAYTGQEWDADTGLYYYNARWYDPATGRFMSPDPIGFAAGDANLMRYVGNSPTNATDPSGLEEGRAWNEPPKEGWLGGKPTQGPPKPGDDPRDIGEVIDTANAENANAEHKILRPGDIRRLNQRHLKAGVFLGELKIAACEFTAAVIEEAIWELATFGASKGLHVTVEVATHTRWYTRWFGVGKTTSSIVITVTDQSLKHGHEGAKLVRTIDDDVIRQYQKRFQDAGLKVPTVEQIAKAIQKNIDAANNAVKVKKGPTGGHHIATHYGAVGDRLKELFKSAGMDIHCDENKLELPGHNGRHIVEYHQLVEDTLKNAVEGLTDEKDRREAVLAVLKKFKLKLFLEPRLPYDGGPLRPRP